MSDLKTYPTLKGVINIEKGEIEINGDGDIALFGYVRIYSSLESIDALISNLKFARELMLERKKGED